MKNISIIDDVARLRHGLLTWHLAEAAGLSRSAWDRAVRQGLFVELYPGVVRLVGTPVTQYQTVLAAVYSCGADAVASHRTAAWLWGVRRPADDPIDVILPNRDRSASVAPVAVHRPRDHADLQPMLRHSIPTTSPVRTLLDLGAVDRRGVRPALEAMLAANLVDLTAVRSAIIRHSKRGRRGIVSIRRACEEINIDGVASDSRLEVVMRRLLAQFRLPPALFHARIEGYEVDFWIVDTPVIIECDGWQYHGLNRDQFELDRARDAALLAAGYVVVRVTWRQLHDEPAAVARRLRGVLATWHTAA